MIFLAFTSDESCLLTFVGEVVYADVKQEYGRTCSVGSVRFKTSLDARRAAGILYDYWSVYDLCGQSDRVVVKIIYCFVTLHPDLESDVVLYKFIITFQIVMFIISNY